ncbi:hypothetical protein JB92DRAFT_2826591 [Gautieria morchelliformis]|nr:hypothetical protein JB92DRAFT_2826591 [Gautieria morchelliformis]
MSLVSGSSCLGVSFPQGQAPTGIDAITVNVRHHYHHPGPDPAEQDICPPGICVAGGGAYVHGMGGGGSGYSLWHTLSLSVLTLFCFWLPDYDDVGHPWPKLRPEQNRTVPYDPQHRNSRRTANVVAQHQSASNETERQRRISRDLICGVELQRYGACGRGGGGEGAGEKGHVGHYILFEDTYDISIGLDLSDSEAGYARSTNNGCVRNSRSTGLLHETSSKDEECDNRRAGRRYTFDGTGGLPPPLACRSPLGQAGLRRPQRPRMPQALVPRVSWSTAHPGARGMQTPGAISHGHIADGSAPWTHGCLDTKIHTSPACWRQEWRNLRAVDQLGWVLTNHGELSHSIPEGIGHPFLLSDEALPHASRAGVTSDEEVGLETHLAHIHPRSQRKGGQGLPANSN